MPEQVFLRQSLGEQGWQEYTWAEVADRVRRLANFIAEQGLPVGSHIALWSSNTVDWVVVDLAIQLSGHVSVPLYPGQDCESARYILDHAQAKLIFLGEFDQQANAATVLGEDIPSVAIRGCSVACDHELEKLLASTAPFESSPIHDPTALLTIVYSSGTTGHPKGVMLTHETPKVGATLLGKWLDTAGADFTGERGRLFSFLPMSHVAERMVVEMAGIYTNSSISFSAGLDTFAAELRSVQPTMFFAVPRLWAKFKAGVDALIPPEAQAELGEAEKKMIRQQLGLDAARCVLSGSAPIPEDIHRWYINMGIALREAYGMSETCGLGTMWQSDDMPVPGTVGTPVADVELRIDSDGEIHFKTSALMVGYYNNPEKTAEVIVDGWYRTGDSGRIDDDGYLRVTGRIGEVFKTTKGKFIHPARIEDRFGVIPELGQLMVFGHGKDQPLLLANLSEFGRAKPRQEVQATLEQALASINADLPPYERVPQIFVTADEWTIDSTLLTPTMKIKRRTVEDCYRDWVEQQLGSSVCVWQ
ncbi:MAG: AMP-binding protein [Gammaproteobacteria bacterium]|nr:AMP-binding protein [Gammaproteobacteria bacterium]